MNALLKAYTDHLHRLVIISDDIRTRELLVDVVSGEALPFRLAALREMYNDGRLVVRPVETLRGGGTAVWRHFNCKWSIIGHALMAVHYFDGLTTAPLLTDLSEDQKEAYRRETLEDASGPAHTQIDFSAI